MSQIHGSQSNLSISSNQNSFTINNNQEINNNDDGYNPIPLNLKELGLSSLSKDEIDRYTRSPEKLQKKLNELKDEINERYDDLLEEHESIKDEDDPVEWLERKESIENKRDSKIAKLNNIFSDAIKTAKNNKNNYIDYIEEKGTPEQKNQLRNELKDNQKIRQELNDAKIKIQIERQSKIDNDTKIKQLQSDMKKLQSLGYKTFATPEDIPLKDKEIYMRSPDAVTLMKNKRINELDQQIKNAENTLKEGKKTLNEESVIMTRDLITNLKARREATILEYDKCIAQATSNKNAYLKMATFDTNLKYSVQNKSALETAITDLKNSSKDYTKKLAEKYKIESPVLKSDVSKATATKRNWGKFFGGLTMALTGVGVAGSLLLGAIPLVGLGLGLAYLACGATTLGGLKTMIGYKSSGVANDFAKGVNESITSAKQILSPVIKGTSAIASAILFKDLQKASTAEEKNNLKNDYQSNAQLLDFYRNIVEGKDIKDEFNKLSKADVQEEINPPAAENTGEAEAIRDLKISNLKTEANILINSIKMKYKNYPKNEINNICKQLQDFIDGVDKIKNKSEEQFNLYMDNFNKVSQMVNSMKLN